MQYKVRDHFYVHLDGKVFEPGAVLELNDEQAERHAVQVEPLEVKAARKGKEG